MITNIKIENYKSLHKIDLDVGRFNVLIGENGCGKSNILEAITLAAAAEADKLDNEFLSSRGIRVTEPHLMRSAFRHGDSVEPIKISMQDENKNRSKGFFLTTDDKPYPKWIKEPNTRDFNINFSTSDPIFEKIKILFNEDGSFSDDEILRILNRSIDERVTNKLSGLQNFVIYSPENTALRNFYKEGQIEPLGINGEGLLKLLKTLREPEISEKRSVFFSFNKRKSKGQPLSKIDEIQATLQLFDWYEDLEIPQDLSESEDKVKITDRYLNETFDQRSTNEGFLFVLFYIALIVSEDTPKIFAIDNIDASLNPKLCTKLISELTRLAKKYDKQVFVTTHNPAILDGIDLGDDEQRLLVISRNKVGYTRCKRIGLKEKPKLLNGEPLKLSEAFLRGYLGALPKGF